MQSGVKSLCIANADMCNFRKRSFGSLPASKMVFRLWAWSLTFHLKCSCKKEKYIFVCVIRINTVYDNTREPVICLRWSFLFLFTVCIKLSKCRRRSFTSAGGPAKLAAPGVAWRTFRSQVPLSSDSCSLCWWPQTVEGKRNTFKSVLLKLNSSVSSVTKMRRIYKPKKG